MQQRPKLFVIGDSVTVTTGFGSVTRNLCKHFEKAWEIHMLAVNYYGDPHPLQAKYQLYVPAIGNDIYGMNRIASLLPAIQPDVIFIVNDAWITTEYVQRIRKLSPNVPIIAYIPVDAEHMPRQYVEPLNQCDFVVAYTHFGLNELKKSGLTTNSAVIYHGIDITDFKPVEQKVARKETGIPDEWYVVTNVARNQSRKRLDLAFYYFAEWVKRTNKPEHVKLYYHGAVNDIGWGLEDLAQYWGIDNRLIITSRDMTPANMLPVEKLKYVYASSDVFFTTCASEGWNLPLAEAMACKVPALVPRDSAMAEWPNDTVEYMELLEDYVNVNIQGVNTIMHVPSLASFIDRMEYLYHNPEYRKQKAMDGYLHITQPSFKWSTIAQQFHTLFIKAVQSVKEKQANVNKDVRTIVNEKKRLQEYKIGS